MALNAVSLRRVRGSTLDPKKRWYSLSSQLVGRKVSQFVKGKFFDEFPSELCRVRVGDLWRESGEHVPAHWFTERKSGNEGYAITLFGLCGGLVKQCTSASDGFLSSDIFKRIVEAVNNFDVGECGVDSKDHGTGSETRTPKSRRIEYLERELSFYRGKVREIEHSIAVTNLETPPNTPASRSGKGHLSDGPPLSIEGIASSTFIGPISKKRQLKSACSSAFEEIASAFNSTYGSLGCILGYGFLYGSEQDQLLVKTAISQAVGIVSKKGSIARASELAFTPELKERQEAAIRVPDWVQLYVKLEVKLPDNGWQTILNFLNLGRSGKETDLQCLLTKNMIKACKSMVFSTTQSLVKINALDPDCGITGYSVGLAQALTWAIREARLHSTASPTMIFNIKLDGRPFAGKDQVSVGVVAVNFSHSSSESSGSVYPLAIGNCKENREEVPKLIRRLNHEKNVIKERGISVDGNFYKIKFVVTLDYKSLLLLIRKILKSDDEEDNWETLGGQGFDVECCVFCTALRACKEHLPGRFDEACLTCLQSKANIGNWTGLRDDLEFLLDEELSHIQLCSLHQEMRNTEQLLGSLGLFAHRIGSLKLCNEAVSLYGPENTRCYDRVKVKLRTGQQTAVTKSNIHVSSMSGSTERAILANSDRIVQESLPVEKVRQYYAEIPDSCRNVILGYVTHHESIKLYLKTILDSGVFTRDFGSKQENVQLKNAKELKKFLDECCDREDKILSKIEQKFLESEQSVSSSKPPPKKKKLNSSKKKNVPEHNTMMVTLAAQLQVDHFRQVFQEWKDISHVIRCRVFEENEEEQIDIHDVKCKLWGLLLRHLYGVTLGMGDYAHLTVAHSAMLFREHRSFRHYSNQGFEASHKEQRMLYSRATSHDSSSEGQSIQQILTHWHAERLLWIRYQFVQAQQCKTNGKKFAFRGCGWSREQDKKVCWSQEDEVWIDVIVDLFTKLFGEDFLHYIYTTDHGMQVAENSDPRKSFVYDHDEWEDSYEKICQEKSNRPVRSAVTLKQLANSHKPKSEEASTVDLDGITPLEMDPLADISNKPLQKIQSFPSKLQPSCNQIPVGLYPTAANNQPSTANLHSAKIPTAAQQTSVAGASQQRDKVVYQLEHGLPMNRLVQFCNLASCVLPDKSSALVTSLVEGAISFKGSNLIDAEDLVALKGCRPTSEEKYLTNFTIEGYLDVIAKQGTLQGKKVEYLGWERFEKVVGKKPAQEVLRGKAPLMHQDVVLVPCNPQGSQHWFLLAVLPKECQILVLDSMAGAFIKPTAKRAISKMWMLLKELDSRIDANQWNCYSNKPVDIPQQQNDFDCGVFICMYARCLVLDHPMPDHIPNFRQIMVLELHQKKLQHFSI